MGGCVFRIQFSDGRVEERELGEGRFQIGREAGAIVLGDAKSSAVHGELVIQGAAVTYTDLGSSNGSFDAHGRRLTEPTRLSPGQSVQLGNSAITYLRAPAPAVAPAPRAVAPTQPMEAVEAPPAPVPLRIASPAPGAAAAGAGRSGFSHPNEDVRHSYPLSIGSASIGEALGLVMRTLPFLLVRFGILCALTVATIIYWIVLVGGFVFLSKATPLLGWIWIVGLLIVGGSIWRFAVRYMLYLIKAAHIAVLTELVSGGETSERALARVTAALARGPEALRRLPGESAAGQARGRGPDGAGPPGQGNRGNNGANGRGRGQGGPPASVPGPTERPGRGRGRENNPGKGNNP